MAWHTCIDLFLLYILPYDRMTTPNIFEKLGLENLLSVNFRTKKDRLQRKSEEKRSRECLLRASMMKLHESKDETEQHHAYIREQQKAIKFTKAERKRFMKEKKQGASPQKELSSPYVTDNVGSIQGQQTAKRLKRNTKNDPDSDVEIPHVILPENSIKFQSVQIHRSQALELQRSFLPATKFEREIIEAAKISAYTGCALICGATGCGKTTQVPQFLWEYGFPDVIAVTQPRRVAVRAMAERVRWELGEPPIGVGRVGYQVRYDRKTSQDTRLLFLTEGILLKQIQQDFSLSQYSAIIIDEAHERSVECDLLLGLLSRIVPLRSTMNRPLAVLIMSATLQLADFASNRKLYPKPPPIVEIESRTYSVTEHYALQSSTLDSYLSDAFLKCIQIHTRLPAGAILCFVPTQRDCENLTRKLIDYFSTTSTRAYDETGFRHNVKNGFSHSRMFDFSDTEHGEFLDKTSAQALSSQIGISDHDSIYDLASEIESNQDDEHHDQGMCFDTLHVLPLYSKLRYDLQQRIFQETPEGKRLCVVATNVAEISLTVPFVRYVVDTGFVKERLYNADDHIYKYHTTQISQSSATQRAGRAGRVAPGHCYRLYSTGTMSCMSPQQIPEITRTPLEHPILLLTKLGVRTDTFPFPTEPRVEDIQCAIQSLQITGAVERKMGTSDSGLGIQITTLGEELLEIPIAPRFAIMLLSARSMPPIVQSYLVDAVSVCSTAVDLFDRESYCKQKVEGKKTAPRSFSDQGFAETNEEEPSKATEKTKNRFLHPGSDMLTAANCLEYYRKAKNRKLFCKKHNIIQNTIRESLLLSIQLKKHRKLFGTTVPLCSRENSHDERQEMSMSSAVTDRKEERQLMSSRHRITHPRGFLSKDEEITFRQIVCRGLLDCVARRATSMECEELHVRCVSTGRTRYVAYVHVLPLFVRNDFSPVKEALYIHPDSGVSRIHPSPEWVVFSMLQKSSQKNGKREFSKTIPNRAALEHEKPAIYMKGVTVTTWQWLCAVRFFSEHREPIE